MEDADKKKLDTLADIVGQVIEDMLEDACFNDVAKSICMNLECNFIADMEPDQEEGYCEVCKTNTVKSCLCLAGII